MGVKKGVGGWSQQKQMLDRREKVKKLVSDRGLSSPTEIMRVLRDEFGIEVSTQTVYEDLKAVSAKSGVDGMSNLDAKLIVFMEKLLKRLEDIVDTTQDERTRISAINAIFKNTRDLYGIVDQISLRNAAVSRMEMLKGKGGGGVVVRFGDEVVDDLVKDEVVDVEDKDDEG